MLHHCCPFTVFLLFSWRNFSTNWLITLTTPKFSTFWTSSLTVFPLVLMHLGLLYGRLFAICALSSSILTSLTSIWLPKSPKAMWLARLAHLPHDKLISTLELLYQWASKRWCTCTELESLIGSLHHITKVVAPGRTFLRCMFDL